MTDVFVSYKHENRDVAEMIATKLQDAGFSVWWDENITPRRPFDSIIEEAIENAHSVVVLWSSLSVGSEWVRTEANFAKNRQKMVPVLIESCEIPMAFQMLQSVDLSHWRGDPGDRYWRKLLTWISDLRALPQQTQSPGTSVANPFRPSIGETASGEPVFDGAFVNEATPPGTLFRDGADLPVMRVLPRGRFLMGGMAGDPDRSSVELPQKNVDIDYALAIGILPVLRSEFERLVTIAAPPPPISARGLFAPKPAARAEPERRSPPDGAVNCVSLLDASAYCRALSAQTSTSYRLPSESEWEYACRGRASTRYCWGDTIDSTQAHFARRDAGPTRPGEFSPNSFGLYDMHGNVREWTQDLWHEHYDLLPADGRPVLAGHGSMRVTRGGGWSDAPGLLRSSARSRATETMRSDLIGFRVVRDLEGRTVDERRS